jgi:hypothetical protein
MPSIAGLRGTGDWATDERPKNFRETILFRQPNGQAPLTALLSKIGDEATDDPEFAWYEEQLNTIRVQETTGLSSAAGSTTLTCAGGGVNDLLVGDVLLVEKTDQTTYNNELVEVSAIASDTSATITRGAAGTTRDGIAANAFLTKIGNVFAEGTGAPTASTRNPTKVLNYCQIFKTIYDVTGTAAQTKTRTGDPIENDKKRKMFDHSIAMEWAFLYGVKNETTGSNSKPKRYTGGLRSFISTNKTVFATTPTITTLLAALYPVFDYNTGSGDERIVFLGNQAANALNLIIANATNVRINFGDTVKVYGMNFQKLVIPQGTFYLKTHPLLNTHARYSASMWVIDPAVLKYRYMKGRDTKFIDNIQNNDEDRKKGMWITECGLEVQHEKTMAYLGNVTYP